MGGRGSTSRSQASGSTLPASVQRPTRASSYRGYDIETSTIPGRFSVEYEGEDVLFRSQDEARRFIDEVSRVREPVPARSVDVRTSRYEFAHGTEPRGYGHWIFVADGTSIGDEASRDNTFEYTGYYRAAKSEAKKWAGRRGEYSVILES